MKLTVKRLQILSTIIGKDRTLIVDNDDKSCTSIASRAGVKIRTKRVIVLDANDAQTVRRYTEVTIV